MQATVLPAVMSRRPPPQATLPFASETVMARPSRARTIPSACEPRVVIVEVQTPSAMPAVLQSALTPQPLPSFAGSPAEQVPGSEQPSAALITRDWGETFWRPAIISAPPVVLPPPIYVMVAAAGHTASTSLVTSSRVSEPLRDRGPAPTTATPVPNIRKAAPIIVFLIAKSSVVSFSFAGAREGPGGGSPPFNIRTNCGPSR